MGKHLLVPQVIDLTFCIPHKQDCKWRIIGICRNVPHENPDLLFKFSSIYLPFCIPEMNCPEWSTLLIIADIIEKMRDDLLILPDSNLSVCVSL